MKNNYVYFKISDQSDTVTFLQISFVYGLTYYS